MCLRFLVRAHFLKQPVKTKDPKPVILHLSVQRTCDLYLVIGKQTITVCH